MKLQLRLLAIAMLVIAAFSFSTVQANNGVEIFEYEDVVEGLYLDCVGETLTKQLFVRGKFHAFVTPAGKFHFIENWTYTTIFTGETTGRIWTGHGAGPTVFNLGPGETLQLRERGVQKPLTGDGPKFKYSMYLMWTSNANGDFVVYQDMLNVPFEDVAECIGKY